MGLLKHKARATLEPSSSVFLWDFKCFMYKSPHVIHEVFRRDSMRCFILVIPQLVISSLFDSGLGGLLTLASAISKCDTSTDLVSAGTLKLVPLVASMWESFASLRMKRAQGASEAQLSQLSSAPHLQDLQTEGNCMNKPR